MPKKDLIIITAIYITVCAIYYISAISKTEPGFPVDDAWIHQVFARNIATGHGFSFNPDRPFAGSTTPLWTLILVPIWKISGPLAGGIIASLILQLLAITGLYKLAGMLTKEPDLPLLAAILSILCWPVIWGALSGMEIGLYSALTFWGLYYFMRSGSVRDRDTYTAYIIFTLAFLSRPECALILMAALTHDLLIWRKTPEKEFKSWLIKGLIIIIFTAPYFIFNYSTSGSIFPQTFTAKVQHKGIISAILSGNFLGIMKTLTVVPYFYLKDFFSKSLLLNPIVVSAFTAGIIRIAIGAPLPKSRRLMFVLLIILYIPAMGALSPRYWPTWQQFRYVTNLLPLVITIGIIGIFQIDSFDYRSFKKPLILIGSALVFFGLALILVSTYIDTQLIPLFVTDVSGYSPERIHEIIRGVGFDTLSLAVFFIVCLVLLFTGIQRKSAVGRPGRIFKILILTIASAITIWNARIYVNCVKYINMYDVAPAAYLGDIAKPGDVVAVNDIGAFGYFSTMEVFDLWGLISPELTSEMINNDSLAFEYMLRNKRVDYAAIVPAWFRYIPRRSDVFVPLKEFGRDEDSIYPSLTTMVYKTVWPDSTLENDPGRR